MFSTPLDPWPRSHYDLVEHYYAQYERQIASGEYQPFLYPWGALGALVTLVYLLVPHQSRPWLRNCKYLVLAWNIGFAVYTMLYTRVKIISVGYGIGVVSVWNVVWVSAILICNDAQTDFMRIERTEGAFGTASTSTSSKEEDGMDSKRAGPRKKRHEPKDTIMPTGTAGPARHQGQYAWQPYPLSPFVERLDWVLDLLNNFRGAGWSWRTSALPPPPKWLQEQLGRNSAAVPKHHDRIHASQARSHPTRTELVAANAKTLLTSCLALDALKTVMMWDPYFWGLVDHPPPSHFPAFITQSARITHVYRITLSMVGIKFALQALFSVAPLVLAGLIGPDKLGARAEPFMYPDTWGPFVAVLDGGLAGWWGNWWHQTFRFGVDQPSRRLLAVFALDRKTLAGKVVQLGVAFGISGLLHAGGSYTFAGETNPIGGSLAFFLWQAVGISAELALTQAARSTELGDRIPKSLKRVFTFVYVHMWFYFTAHLLIDDVARGGLWLVEPVPVSLFRGMGLGADKRDGWWCWDGPTWRWHSGDRWWNSGIAV